MKTLVILRVACDNIYMFKNFELDLTYNHKINHPISENDELFEGSKIYVRKNIIIMGANASGKTTFGKLLCLILNFIRGTELRDKYFNPVQVCYDKSRESSFELEFAVGDTAYLLKAFFKDSNLQREEVYWHKIYKSYDVEKLRDRLYSSEHKSTFDAKSKKISIGFKSYSLSVSESDEFSEQVRKPKFRFMLSEPLFFNTTYGEETDIKFLGKLLPAIDNSVESVKGLQLEGESILTNSYQIRFKNGERLNVVSNDLESYGYRLSHGTFEALNFILLLNALKQGNISTFYVDERLSHMHSELEAYLARQAFLIKSGNTQLFFTTHNVELLSLNAPVTSYIMFNRTEDGFNEAVRISDKVKKSNVNLRNYYDNDYFGMMPDYSNLDELFKSL